MRTARSRTALLAGLLVIGGGAMVAWFLGRPARANILFITLDTVRADHCSLYGYPRRTTKNLEALGLRAVVFEDAYAPMATSSPSHASMFTGLYPIAHGVLSNSYVLSPAVTTLAEILSAREYETAAVISSFVLNRKFGLSQGFGAYHDFVEEAAGGLDAPHGANRAAESIFDQQARSATNKGITLLETLTRRRKPFFLWVHYFDPHAPYDPPPPHDHFLKELAAEPASLTKDVARYDGEIEYMDAEIGRLLAAFDRLRLRQNTIVVVAGDHGEGLMQHGHMAHGLHLYEEAVRVPLLIAWDSKLNPRRVSGSVGLVDLTPTLLDLLGERPLKSVDGVSLAGCVKARERCEDRQVFLQRRHYDEGAQSPSGKPIKGYQFGLRDGKWKYLEALEEAERRELYDLQVDPGEKVNLASRTPEQTRRFASRIRSILRNRILDGRPQNISDEDRQKLKSLGYLQ